MIVRAEFPVGADVLSSAMAGGGVGGMDTVRSTRETITRDIVVYGTDEGAYEEIVGTLRGISGISGIEVLDGTNGIFRAHEGGKLAIAPRRTHLAGCSAEMGYA